MTIKRGLHKHLLLFMRLVKFSSSVARLNQVLKTCEIFVIFVVSSSKTKVILLVASKLRKQDDIKKRKDT